MKATTHQRTNYLPLLLIALVAAILAYGALPKTDHAYNGHTTQKWNVHNIQSYFDAGKCKPTVYVCNDLDIEIHYCEMDNKNSIGLVIGHTVREIVTGFMARTTYWKSRC